MFINKKSLLLLITLSSFFVNNAYASLITVQATGTGTYEDLLLGHTYNDVEITYNFQVDTDDLTFGITGAGVLSLISNLGSFFSLSIDVLNHGTVFKEDTFDLSTAEAAIALQGVVNDHTKVQINAGGTLGDLLSNSDYFEVGAEIITEAAVLSFIDPSNLQPLIDWLQTNPYVSGEVYGEWHQYDPSGIKTDAGRITANSFSSISYSITTTSVPEPSSMALFSLVLAVVGFTRKRKHLPA